MEIGVTVYLTTIFSHLQMTKIKLLGKLGECLQKTWP